MEIIPTFFGYIESNRDSLLLIQAVLDGKLQTVSRRPYEIERSQLIKSGNIFVFIEEKSGIKRWTDGISWSPSRIMGKFLIYRELDKNNRSKELTASQVIKLKHSKGFAGSLNSPYGFKLNGLVKKAMSLKLQINSLEETIHIVSYYNTQDVESGQLLRPTQSDLFHGISPCFQLVDSLENCSIGNSGTKSSTSNGNINPGKDDNKHSQLPQYEHFRSPSVSYVFPAYNQTSKDVPNSLYPTLSNNHYHGNSKLMQLPPPSSFFMDKTLACNNNNNHSHSHNRNHLSYTRNHSNYSVTASHLDGNFNSSAHVPLSLPSHLNLASFRDDSRQSHQLPRISLPPVSRFQPSVAAGINAVRAPTTHVFFDRTSNPEQILGLNSNVSSFTNSRY